MGLSQALGAVPLLSLSLRSPFLSESTKSQEKYAWNEGLGRSCAWKRPALCSLSYPLLDCLLSWASLRAGDVGGVPTPVTKTQAWGGWLWGLGYGSSQRLGGLQAAAENFFLKGCIPSAGETCMHACSIIGETRGNKIPLNTCTYSSFPLSLEPIYIHA